MQLIAVSKRHGVEKIVECANAGQRDFAENFLQEGVEKIEQCKTLLKDKHHTLQWHFIGHIQSRKCKEIAQHFDWVHTVESIKVAQKLNQHRVGAPLKVLIQINIDEEETKSGVSPQHVNELAAQIVELENLSLQGLMIIPRIETDFEKQRQPFIRCRQLLNDLNQQGYGINHLSMGMTNDMEAAIAEGATQVRIGTALFGQRPTPGPTE